MDGFTPVGAAGDFTEGTMKTVNAGEHEVLLARSGGAYYAADSRCPHMGARLSEGKLEGTVVTCPRHGSRFDLRDGQVVRWLKGDGLLTKAAAIIKPPHTLKVYPVKVENGQVLVQI